MRKYAKPEMEQEVVNVQMPLAESPIETGEGDPGAGGDAQRRRGVWGGW